MLGRNCIVRTQNAGVFAGTVATLDGQTAKLTDARRIWYWDGAESLSQLATTGTSKPGKCKFPAPVKEVLLFEVIEIIPITDVAAECIAKVPEWKS